MPGRPRDPPASVAGGPAALGAAAAGVPLRAARPGPLLHRARRGLGRAARPSTSTSPARSCSTSAAARATSATRSGRGRDVPSRSTRTSGSSPGSDAHRRGHRPRQRDAAAVPRRRRSTSATPPTCSSTWPTLADGRRDAPGDQARRQSSSSATRSGSARGAATRPRPWHYLGGDAGASPLRAPARPRAEEQVRRVAVRGHRSGTGSLGATDRPRPTSVDVLPALQPAVGHWLLARPGAARGGDVEPRDRAAEAVSPARSARPAPASRRSGSRLSCAAAGRAGVRPGRRASWSPTPSSTWSLDPGRLPGPGRCTSGTPRARSASCRTRPTATCGRWARSSCSASRARPPRLGGAAALAGAGAVRGVRRRRRGWPGPSACGPTSPASSPASPTRCRRGCSPRSGRSRSRPGRARWRPGCCCRWSGLDARARRAGRPRCRRCAVAMVGGVNAAATFAVLPLGRRLAADPDARSATPHADALVAGVHRARHAVVAGPAVRAGRLQPAVPRLHRVGRRSRPSRRPCSTRCGAPRTGSRTSTRTSRAGNDLLAAVLPAAQQRGRAAARAGRAAAPRATRTGCSWCCRVLVGLLMVTLGHTGVGAGLVRRRSSRALLDGAAGSAAQRAQVRPGAPAAAGARASPGPWSRRVRCGAAEARAADAGPGPRRPGWSPGQRTVVLVATALVVVGGAALPAAGRPDHARRRHPRDPGLLDADRRLARASTTGAGSALLLPGSAFADYVWGSPQDEPMQALGRSRGGRCATSSR